MFDFRFLDVPKKSIDLDKIKEFIADENAKRINFSSSHSNAIKPPTEKLPFGCINLPFTDTVEPFIKSMMGSEFNLFPAKKFSGSYRLFKSDEEYKSFKDFADEYSETVFLRDCLDLSLSLSMNFHEEEHTGIGELEYQAKFHNNKDAELKLIEIVKMWLGELPYFKIADCICAMPCSNKNEKGLPRRIIDELDIFEDISEKVYWQSKTKKLKDAESVEKKLEILEESNLKIDRDLKGKSVILFDDLYMSGLSMQYVAMKLKESGASRVFGLAIVKSRSNTTR